MTNLILPLVPQELLVAGTRILESLMLGPLPAAHTHPPLLPYSPHSPSYPSPSRRCFVFQQIRTLCSFSHMNTHTYTHTKLLVSLPLFIPFLCFACHLPLLLVYPYSAPRAESKPRSSLRSSSHSITGPTRCSHSTVSNISP